MFKKLLIIVLLSSMVMTGCSNANKMSLLPGDIVAHAIEANDKIQSYYMETKMIMYEGDKVIEEMIMKQWVSLVDGIAKSRAEVSSSNGEYGISTNDGEKLITYDEKNNTAFIITMKEGMNELLGTTFKEQTKNSLEFLNKTHDVENLGEEEIDGVKAYHLKATPKKEKTLIGQQEMWIDKESWVVVKIISYTLGEKLETQVIKFDGSPEIKDSLFIQDIPADAKIVNMDDNQLEENIVTMEELTEIMGKPLLYIPESLGYELRKISMYKFSEDSPEEVTQEYFKDGMNKINIYIVKQEKDIEISTVFPDEEEIEIRGMKGYVLDDFMRTISFIEDEIRYTFHIQDDDMEIKEAIKLVEEMIYYK